LVLPPKLASIQAVITTITPNEEAKVAVPAKAQELALVLKNVDIKTHVDARDIRPGEKYFEWEKKGVPIRIELGPKDIENNNAVLVRRDTGEKKSVSIPDLAREVFALLEEIQKNLFDRALQYQKEKTVSVDSWEDFVKAIEADKFVLAHWSGDADVEAKIKEETMATIRCIPLDQTAEDGVCIKSGKPSKGRVIFAKAY